MHIVWCFFCLFYVQRVNNFVGFFENKSKPTGVVTVVAFWGVRIKNGMSLCAEANCVTLLIFL